MMNRHGGRNTIRLSYKNITSHFILEKDCVRDGRETGRQRQTAILTYNFFLAALCYLQDLTSSIPTRRIQHVLVRGPLDSLRSRFSIC